MVVVSTYPYGYAQPPQRLTLAELDRRATWVKLHPELRRRLVAMFDAAQDAGTDLGLGGGWRSSQIQLAMFLERHAVVPSGGCCGYNGKRYALKPGKAHAAPPGLSYHEPTTPAGEAFAADLIGDLAWMNANAARFGLVHFAAVNNEPWHVQPTELPRARTNYAGEQLAAWPLPSDPIQPPTPTPEDSVIVIVGRKDNPADPRRWAWNGVGVHLIPSEDDYLSKYASGLLFKLHPTYSTLASPYWMTDAELRSYVTAVAP
jgi:hypothetical protein